MGLGAFLDEKLARRDPTLSPTTEYKELQQTTTQAQDLFLGV